MFEVFTGIGIGAALSGAIYLARGALDKASDKLKKAPKIHK